VPELLNAQHTYHRLKCDVCGDKSTPVYSKEIMTQLEIDELDNFITLHKNKCYRSNLKHVVPFPQCGAFGIARPNPVHVSKPHGHATYFGPYGEIQTVETLQCCHCQKHWEVRVGSERTRSWCMNCAGPVCGGPNCRECIPKEAKLENQEAGKPINTPLAAKILVPEFPTEVN
jgi:hypothetical protein